MKFGVIVFPGSLCDTDCFNVLQNVFQQQVEYVWHKTTDISSYDCVILPGGFSYGDHLRAGAIAKSSPIMSAIKSFSDKGKFVLGICNGFQVLCEAALLPGALIQNSHIEFRCEWTHIRIENNRSPFTSKTDLGQSLRIPIAHGEGHYFVNETTFAEMQRNDQIIFRYSSIDGKVNDEFNPNGSMDNVAGVSNAEGNVLGMMPHPERCCESILGGEDGKYIFESLIENVNT